MRVGISYDMPAAEYQAAPALSAGGAWTLATECPAMYWHKSPFNPAREPDESNAIMDIGTALHLAVLEPGQLARRTAPIDSDAYRTTKARAQREAAQKASRIPLLTKDAELVERLAGALRANKYAANILDGAHTEVSYFWSADGLACKARADIITHDDRAIGDLKASGSASPEFFQRQAFSAGHFLRSVWYRHGWKALTGKDAEYWFLVVGREEPHLVTVARLDERATVWGQLKMRRALALWRACRERGVWPPYCPEPVTLSLPGWSEYRLADEEQTGAFDPDAIRRGIEFLAPTREKSNA